MSENWTRQGVEELGGDDWGARRPGGDRGQALSGDEQGAWHGSATTHWAVMICSVATYNTASTCGDYM
jgi:hypothetical protein